MRVGVLADLHGNAPATEAVLEELKTNGIHHLLIAGDLVGYYPFVNETLDLVRQWSADVVLGNHDAYLLGRLECTPERREAYGLDLTERLISRVNREWLAQLPFERQLLLDGRRILLCHGSPAGPEHYIYPDRTDWSLFEGLAVDIVVLGHTHYALSRRQGDTLLVNPGSCGQPRDYDPRASYGILDLQTLALELQRTTYDTERVIQAVAHHNLPPALGTILTRRQQP